MKKLVLIASAVLFSVSLGLGAAVAKDAPKEAVKVSNYGKKKPVMFDHDKHKEVDCEKCHHKVDGKKNVELCGNCHKVEAEGKAPGIKDAFHKKGMGPCYDCHLDKESENKLKCADCHKE